MYLFNYLAYINSTVLFRDIIYITSMDIKYITLVI